MPARHNSAQSDELEAPAYLEPATRTNWPEVLIVAVLLGGFALIGTGAAFSSLTIGVLGAGFAFAAMLFAVARRSLLVAGIYGNERANVLTSYGIAEELRARQLGDHRRERVD
jgi:hypothetical protein